MNRHGPKPALSPTGLFHIWDFYSFLD